MDVARLALISSRDAGFSGVVGLGGQLFADLDQVIGNGSQSYPTFHAFHSAIATAQ
jgi:hypothetical protein